MQIEVEKMSKVMIAMSGGVDSAVSAYLLKAAGYQVVGATMKLYCPNKENMTDHIAVFNCFFDTIPHLKIRIYPFNSDWNIFRKILKFCTERTFRTVYRIK